MSFNNRSRYTTGGVSSSSYSSHHLPAKKTFENVFKCANPYFLTWLIEVFNQTVDKKGSENLLRTYNKAIKNLSEYPLELKTGQDSTIVVGIGPKIAKILDAKMKENNMVGVSRSSENSSAPNSPAAASSTKRTGITNRVTSTPSLLSKRKRTRKRNVYIPAYRSGGYGLLVALYNLTKTDSYRGVTKPELIEAATEFCDTSYKTTQKKDYFYTAWNSMKTLIAKELVMKMNSCPMTFQLTNEGIELSLKLLVAEGDKEARVRYNTINTVCSRDKDERLDDVWNDGLVESESEFEILGNTTGTAGIGNDIATPSNGFKAQTLQLLEKFKQDNNNSNDVGCGERSATNADTTAGGGTFGKGQFPTVPKEVRVQEMIPCNELEIVLLLDNREVLNRLERNKMYETLTDTLKVNCQVRALPVGDFVWVARRKGCNGIIDHSQEYILGWIGERKRMDDLVGSIIDGRYREQKNRLRKSQLKVTYLVEDYGPITAQQMDASRIRTAILGITLFKQFTAKQTKDNLESMNYLKNMTDIITQTLNTKDFVIKVDSDYLSDADNGNGNGFNRQGMIEDLLGKTYNMDTHHCVFYSYNEFEQSCVKTKQKTVTDLFSRQLMCIRGCTVDKTIAIVKEYPTLFTLYKAYSMKDTRDGELLLAKLKHNGRSIGPKLSKIIYDLYANHAKAYK